MPWVGTRDSWFGCRRSGWFSGRFRTPADILGMAPTRLQTPEILHARRVAYELDLFWPPPVDHATFAKQILTGDGDPTNYDGTGGTRPVGEDGEFSFPVEPAFLPLCLVVTFADGVWLPRLFSAGRLVREFAKADRAVQRLIDPTWQKPAL
jgi:hypothetical protein